MEKGVNPAEEFVETSTPLFDREFAPDHLDFTALTFFQRPISQNFAYMPPNVARERYKVESDTNLFQSSMLSYPDRMRVRSIKVLFDSDSLPRDRATLVNDGVLELYVTNHIIGRWPLKLFAHTPELASESVLSLVNALRTVHVANAYNMSRWREHHDKMVALSRGRNRLQGWLLKKLFGVDGLALWDWDCFLCRRTDDLSDMFTVITEIGNVLAEYPWPRGDVPEVSVGAEVLIRACESFGVTVRWPGVKKLEHPVGMMVMLCGLYGTRKRRDPQPGTHTEPIQ